ncbi:MAG TPA: response regulator, partial [Gemmatimonadaceae bacterium]
MLDDSPLVAVIDDDEATCRAVARCLTADGYRVRTYTTAREYLEETDAASPACLLVDIRMPDLDGLTLFRTMRDGGGDVPAVFMTGTGDVSTVVEAMKEGALDLLAKPFSADALRVAIARATDSSRQLRDDRRSLADL